MKLTRGSALALVAGSVTAAFVPNFVRAQTPAIRIGQNANDAFGEGYYSGDQGYFTAASTAQIQALGVAPDSTIRSAKDFEGRTIAVPALVSISSMAVKQWLVKNGADLSKVKFVELSQAAMPPAVSRGTVAGAHVGEPFLSGAGTTVRKVAIPAESIAKSYLINEWFTTRDWLAANTATARKLAGVIYDTARWANGHQSDSAVILSKYTKIDVDKIRGMTRAKYATTLQPQLIQPELDMAFTYGGLPRHVDAGEMIGRT